MAKRKPEFEPKIVAFTCNWCTSAFFFEAFHCAGFGSAKKTPGELRNLPSPARGTQLRRIYGGDVIG
jgi:hypothetical protein